MPLEFISHREYVETTQYRYEFRSVGLGGGYSFDCTPQGEIRFNPAHEETQRQSLATARMNVAAGTMREVGLISWQQGYWEPAVVRCHCGARVVLEDSMTNSCDRCGQYMNGSGQLLRDPSEWDPDDRYAVFGPQNVADDDY